MIPSVYSMSAGQLMAVPLDGMHRHEVLLTILQSLLGLVLLLNMRYSAGEALMIFVTWFAQFVIPSIRVEIMYVYGLLILGGLVQVLRGRRGMSAFRIFARQWRQYGKQQPAARK
jgi:hypothetical protein